MKPVLSQKELWKIQIVLFFRRLWTDMIKKLLLDTKKFKFLKLCSIFKLDLIHWKCYVQYRAVFRWVSISGAYPGSGSVDGVFDPGCHTRGGQIYVAVYTDHQIFHWFKTGLH